MDEMFLPVKRGKVSFHFFLIFYSFIVLANSRRIKAVEMTNELAEAKVTQAGSNRNGCAGPAETRAYGLHRTADADRQRSDLNGMRKF
ncbi:hypothetical protein [Paraburkholderia phosphatilytica]|uniref:hypothetical protein n=1 Tax=Paraburkholderia phosphatilytica TaxID=2282883 RepID=UPI000F5F503B|nr:hypothetical protein [Paraburkholderia phosphatilytica]